MSAVDDRRTSGRRSLLDPSYRWATIGMTSLVFLAAFEALAVTTIMPAVSADLDGRAWYAAAFSATLAASVVGMVAAGRWGDRRGPVAPLVGSLVVFSLGLAVAGFAPSMPVFVVARLLQGWGAGAMTVSLYVLVAAVFAPVDRPRVFAVFAAAWVLPSMVGPTLAGLAAETVGWRWVFLGVIVLAGGAAALLLPSVRTAAPRRDGPAQPLKPLVLAVAVAVCVAGLDVAGRVEGWRGVVVGAASLGFLVASMRPLLPAGTLRGAPGLPAVVLLRGVIAAAFVSAEVYVPFLLQDRYGAPAWLSGLGLTVGALGWAGASQVQGVLGPRLSDASALRVGAVLLAGGLANTLLVTSLGAPGWWVPAGWIFAGAGMGLMMPRISTLVLQWSDDADRGRNSAAMSVADSVGGAVLIAVGGLAFAAGEFAAVFLVSVVTAGVGVLVSRRTSRARAAALAPAA